MRMNAGLWPVVAMASAIFVSVARPATLCGGEPAPGGAPAGVQAPQPAAEPKPIIIYFKTITPRVALYAMPQVLSKFEVFPVTCEQRIPDAKAISFAFDMAPSNKNEFARFAELHSTLQPLESHLELRIEHQEPVWQDAAVRNVSLGFTLFLRNAKTGKITPAVTGSATGSAPIELQMHRQRVAPGLVSVATPAALERAAYASALSTVNDKIKRMLADKVFTSAAVHSWESRRAIKVTPRNGDLYALVPLANRLPVPVRVTIGLSMPSAKTAAKVASEEVELDVGEKKTLKMALPEDRRKKILAAGLDADGMIRLVLSDK